MLRIKAAIGVEGFQRSVSPLELLKLGIGAAALQRNRFAHPGLQRLRVALEAAIADQLNRCCCLRFQPEVITPVQGLEPALHRSDAVQLAQLMLNAPVFAIAELLELLQGHWTHQRLPLGSNGRRSAETAVALAGTVWLASCCSRIVCRLSGSGSRISRKVCSAWKMLATTM